MKNKKITHGVVVPLIGGLAIASEEVFGGPPEFVLTYDAFLKNDSHYIHWLHNTRGNGHVPYHNISNEQIESLNLKNSVDVVSALPPCAGLSTFSYSSSSESPVNDWMYKTTEDILEHIAPKVLWGENAPTLFTNRGLPVVKRLFQIGQLHGYSLLLYKTASKLHGNPQIRPRTFYFFFKNTQALPKFSFIEKPQESIYDLLLNSVNEARSDDAMNIEVRDKIDIDSNAWVNFIKYKVPSFVKTTEDIIHYYPKDKNILNKIIHSMKVPLSELESYLNEHYNDSSPHRKIKALVEKSNKKMESEGKGNIGVWSHGELYFAKDEIGAFILPLFFSLINFSDKKTGPRFITYREAFDIMKFPKDFTLLNFRDYNHICQNVIVSTAKDMAEMIADYLLTSGKKFDRINSNLVRIDNISKNISFETIPNTVSLFDDEYEEEISCDCVSLRP